MAADGTVTHIDGNRVYAFGHRFLDVGATALPFARADVIALVPNLNTVFKLSTAREWMGTIYQDRNTAISGELGKRVPLVPGLDRRHPRRQAGAESTRCRWSTTRCSLRCSCRWPSTPTIDATERTVGAATFRITGEVEFQNAPAPVRLDNMFAADNGSAMQASLSAAIPVAYVMQSEFRRATG